MAIPWGAVVFVAGLVYGFATPGRLRSWRILSRGLLVGVVLAILSVLLGEALGANPLGLGRGFWSVLGSVLGLTLLFILGAFLGEMMERRR